VLYAAGAAPVDIASADFDGDGISDLAIANNGSNNVTVLLGIGDGTFRAGSNFAAGTAPRAIVAMDSGPWGNPDLAVANADGVSLLFGFGDGGFSAPTPFATGGTGTSALVPAALSGSAAPDLIAVDSGSNDVSVRLNSGFARFGPSVKYLVGTGPRAVAAGDFNNDGSADLAAINTTSNSLSVLLNDAHGVMQPAVSYSLPAQPQFVVAADFNADGFIDLAVAHAGNTVSLLLNRGDGSFQNAIAFAAGGAANFLAIGDFNGDGRADLAVLNTAGNAVSILPGAAPAVARVRLTTSVLPAGSGSVALSPPSADGTYPVGTKLQVTALASDGYLFTAFGGAITGATNPQTITLANDASVSANFSPASPAIGMSIGGKTTVAGVTTFNLILTNTGAGPAGAVALNAVTVKPLAGTGTVTATAPVLPYSVAPIAAGASASVPVRVTIVGAVSRFSLTVTGTMTNKFGVILSLSGTQAVVP
jgi:hypothetical protein